MGYKYLDSSIQLNQSGKNFSIMPEEREKKRDKNASNSSYYPPSFYKIRQKIFDNFSYSCFLCGSEGVEIHHINYNTMNNSEKNLMLLCKKCHSRTNHSRAWWEKELKEKMSIEFSFDHEEEEENES